VCNDQGSALYSGGLFSEFIVVVRGDRAPGDKQGSYELATPHVFLTRSLAEEYAAEVDPSRAPLVVRGGFSGLTFD
jgi:hypothetical protein